MLALQCLGTMFLLYPLLEGLLKCQSKNNVNGGEHFSIVICWLSCINIEL